MLHSHCSTQVNGFFLYDRDISDDLTAMGKVQFHVDDLNELMVSEKLLRRTTSYVGGQLLVYCGTDTVT